MLLDSEDIERLRRIGLSMPALQALLDDPELSNDPERTRLARVVEVQRDHLMLHDGDAPFAGRPLPALIRRLQDDGDGLAVGDWVGTRRDAAASADDWWVHARLPPLNCIARRLHDGRDKVTRAVIVSNIDTALLVMGLDLDFNLRRLERYLALVRAAGVGAVVVLTKADLCDDLERRRAAVQALLPPDIALVGLDARSDDARLALGPWLQRGQTLVAIGSSGAGKSTLTNTLAATDLDVQATGGTRRGDGRGRHTTTVRSLHLTPEGACVIDTPGLRTLRLDVEADDVDAAFDDVARLAPLCRFRDCAHENEPGCAVRAGVPAERLRNYHKLLREARRDTLTALERKAQVAVWKQRSRAGRARSAEKRE